MSRNEHDARLAILNRSGFPFQLRVEAEISRVDARPPWGLFRELHWRHPTTAEGGYIDLIASHGAMRVVIECKRFEGANWFFLVPGDEQRELRRAKCLSVARVGQSSIFLWDDLWIDPPSFEAPFCYATWKDGKDGMLLEKIADQLLQAVEALALTEINYTGQPRFLLPLVVTTARLHVARFAPEKASIDSGELADADFRDVPLLRFRKGMAHGFPPPVPPLRSKPVVQDLAYYAGTSERTMFVINSSHVNSFFNQLEVHPPPTRRWPHEEVKEQLEKSGRLNGEA